jgi:hypothetical protein
MGGDGSGRNKDIKPRKILKEVIPISELFEEDEQELYESLVDIYMSDFEGEDMSSGDIDDVMSLATNRVMEIRLLKTAKGQPDRNLDIHKAIESIRKQNDKIKENLSSRRKDRIDPNEFKGFSIIDLALAFDNEKKEKMEKKARKLKREEKEVMKEYEKCPNNRYDQDEIKEKDKE